MNHSAGCTERGWGNIKQSRLSRLTKVRVTSVQGTASMDGAALESQWKPHTVYGGVRDGHFCLP